MPKGLSYDEMIRMIADVAEPAAASFGLTLWGIEMEGAGRPVARVFVDAPASGAANPLEPNISGAPCDAGDLPSDTAPDASDVENAELNATDALNGALLPPGVSVGECAEISRMVGLALDVEEAFPDAWVLEVSSPGMNRIFFSLEQMVPYVGHIVDVALRETSCAYAERRKFRGDLREVDLAERRLTVRVEGLGGEAMDAVLAFADVRKARLVPVFPDTSKPQAGKKAGHGGGSHES